MNDKEKAVAYELHIEDMLNVLVERLAEFEGKTNLILFNKAVSLPILK